MVINSTLIRYYLVEARGIAPLITWMPWVLASFDGVQYANDSLAYRPRLFRTVQANSLSLLQ